MMKLVTVEEMRTIEQEADSGGFGYSQMMKIAGLGVAAVVGKRYNHLTSRVVVGLVGSGNNGGDTLVALTALAQAGWQTRAYLVRERDESDPLVSRFLNAGGMVLSAQNDPASGQLGDWLSSCSILLDGVFGTGVKLPLQSDSAAILKYVKDHKAGLTVVAVDCPSGVDCNSGAVAPECIPADITICIEAVKSGLIQFPAFELVGQLEVASLGLPEDLKSSASLNRQVVTSEWVSTVLPDRPMNAHKGTFGTALIVAGSINYCGAAALAAKGAYRSGAGLVTLAVIGSVQMLIASSLPEATWILLPQEEGVISAEASGVLLNNLGRATAMLIGPGFGTEDTTAEFIEHLFKKDRMRMGQAGLGFLTPSLEKAIGEESIIPPLVMDADGLRLLVKMKNWADLLPEKTVLTPHPGEMAVLTGLPLADIQANRIEIALKYARQWNHIVVLKGALTVIAGPDGRAAVIPIASAALARAGTGDVLAGIITGLRAQGMPAFEAAAAGAWIHGRAGLDAARKLHQSASVLASDILDAIPGVLGDITKN